MTLLQKPYNVAWQKAGTGAANTWRQETHAFLCLSFICFSIALRKQGNLHCSESCIISSTSSLCTDRALKGQEKKLIIIGEPKLMTALKKIQPSQILLLFHWADNGLSLLLLLFDESFGKSIVLMQCAVCLWYDKQGFAKGEDLTTGLILQKQYPILNCRCHTLWGAKGSWHGNLVLKSSFNACVLWGMNSLLRLDEQERINSRKFVRISICM